MTTEPDGLVRRLRHHAGQCSCVECTLLREAADALSAAQRLIEQWRACASSIRADYRETNDGPKILIYQRCADDLAALLSERSPQQEEKTDSSQR